MTRFHKPCGRFRPDLLPLLLAATLLFCTALPRSGHAQSWSLGVTAFGEVENGPQAELLIERQFRPFADAGRWTFAPGAAARITDSTGYWIGGGVIASRLYGKDGQWRFDAGLMPGYYDMGDEGRDLGSDLEFRSFLSLGRKVADGYYVGLEFEHMSNAGIETRNPGDNRLILRVMKVDLR